MKKCKVLSVKLIGKKKTFNLTMKSEQHNYALFDASDDGQFALSRNSCCYGYLSYQTAYLKANYTDEYYVSLLNTLAMRGSWDKFDMILKDLKRRKDIKVLDTDINECQVEWRIVRKRDKKLSISRSEIRPGLVVKGVGAMAAQSVADHQPYKDLRTLAAKTDGEVVTSERIAGLAEAGFFGKHNKDHIVDQFIKARNDIKKSRDRGIDNDTDLFDN